MNTLGVKKWCICFLCISFGVAALIFNGVFARVNISVSGGSSGDGLNEVANKTLGHSIYTGTVNKAGEPHGKGVQMYSWGEVYEGKWRKDVYEGDFRNGVKHGKGTYTFGDGRKYVGDYKDGNKHGKGAYTWSDGEKYVGDFECGEMHGQGIRMKADGTAIHSGAWVKNKPAESLPETLGQCEDYFKRRRESQGFNSKALEVGGMTSWSYKDPFY